MLITVDMAMVPLRWSLSRWLVFGAALTTLTLHYTQCISMNPKQYRTLVEHRCFNETELFEPFMLGQHKPVGQTIDYFIELVQNIENKLPLLTASDMLVMLLRRFHYDGIEFNGLEHVQTQIETSRRIMTETLFQNITSLVKFPEDILNEDEKCALFFMVSHTINQTKVHDWKVYKELGVVSLLNSNNFAIGLNRVLMGIAVALLQVPRFVALYGNLTITIDPLMAVTLADRLALASLDVAKSYQNNYKPFGADGYWNSSYCQTEYKLRSEALIPTLAEINGGIDGWLIGNKLRSESGLFLKKLKLSSILKHYYSGKGLAPDCGICQSNYFTNDMLDIIRQDAKFYVLQWNVQIEYNNFDQYKLVGYVEYAAKLFSELIQKAQSFKYNECIRMTSINIGNDQCETTSDVFIMIDNNAFEYKQFHLEAISRLLVELKSLEFLGQITVLVNAQRGFDSEIMTLNSRNMEMPLHLLAYNTTSVEKATCRLAWYNYRETSINNKKILVSNLVHFFERENVTNADMSDSRNLIWFSLKYNGNERLNDRDKRIYYQYKWYLMYHLNVRTFFVSSYSKNVDDELYNIMLNKDDWFQVNPTEVYDDKVIKKIARRICETPSHVRYLDCEKQRSKGVSQEYLISPNKKQYWALYPKYFLDSEQITLEFAVKDSHIRICLDRYLFPDNINRNCQETNADKNAIKFVIEQPCRWNRTMESCQPIYFTVTSGKDLVPNDCLETNCRTFDQIRWTLTHYGLQCTSWSAKMALDLPLLSLLSLISLIINYV